MTAQVGPLGLLRSYTPSSQTQEKRYVNMMVQTPKANQSAWSFNHRAHQPVDEADQRSEEAILSIGSRTLEVCLTGLRRQRVGEGGQEVQVPTKTEDMGREEVVEAEILPRETGGAI